MQPVPSSFARDASSWERLALGSGILFAVAQIGAMLFSFGVVVPTHAPVGAPPAETAAALAAHSGLIAAGTYLFTLPVPFLLLFLGGLFEVVRRSEGGGMVPAAVILVAGVAAAVIAPMGAVLSGLGAPMAILGGDPAIVTEVDSITPLAMALAGYPYAVLAGVTSLVVLRGGITPRWIGWSGLALAALCLAATATIAIRDLFPLTLLETLLFPLWVLAISVALVRRRRSAGLEGAERRAA